MNTMPEFMTTLRARGRKVTAQRLHIYRVLGEHGGHPTAEEVYARVRETLPTVSLTTVYKVLNELVGWGEAQRVVLGDGTARFDPAPEPHVHLLCQGCGRLSDSPTAAPPIQIKAPAVVAGFRVHSVRLTLDGLCPSCQAAASEAPAS